jgi:predicted DNA-binding transcriptional regulator
MEDPGDIPAEVRAFISSCIDTVEVVEILSLLVQSNRPWTVKAAGGELRLAENVVRAHVEMLGARGLVKITAGPEVSYQYAPKTSDLRRYAELLCEHYAKSPVTIIRFIAARPRRAAEGFADAFKLRGFK